MRPQDFYLVLFRQINDTHHYGYWLGAARSFSPKTSEGRYTSPLLLVQNVWSEASDQTIHLKSQTINTYQVQADHCMSLDIKKCFESQGTIWDLKRDYFQKILQ